jgi:hypothetical protein
LKALYADVAPARFSGKDSTAIVFRPAQTKAEAQPTSKKTSARLHGLGATTRPGTPAVHATAPASAVPGRPARSTTDPA